MVSDKCKVNYSAEELLQIIENYERYRIHYLEENPKDLPEEDSAVFACIDYFGEELWMVCDYSQGAFRDGINPPEFISTFVVAWRYIEPSKLKLKRKGVEV